MIRDKFQLGRALSGRHEAMSQLCHQFCVVVVVIESTCQPNRIVINLTSLYKLNFLLRLPPTNGARSPQAPEAHAGAGCSAHPKVTELDCSPSLTHSFSGTPCLGYDFFRSDFLKGCCGLSSSLSGRARFNRKPPGRARLPLPRARQKSNYLSIF